MQTRSSRPVLFRISIFVYLITFFLNPFVVLASGMWTELNPFAPAGVSDKAWYAAAMDASGTKFVVGIYSGHVYTSVDSGGAWTERSPDPSNGGIRYWSSVASNSTGTLLAAVSNSDVAGKIWISSNSGVDWIVGNGAPVGKWWTSVASDADGTNLIASHIGTTGAVAEGGVYISTNSGTDWIEVKPAGEVSRRWIKVVSDSAGTNLFVASNQYQSDDGGRLYTSSNGGVDWIERQPLGNTNNNWRALASDSTGQYLVAGINSVTGRLYASSDYGATWNEVGPKTDGNFTDQKWFSVASDSTGINLIAGTYSTSTGLGRLYKSSNSGSLWAESQPEGDVDRQWTQLASNSDGTVQLVGANGGRLYAYGPDLSVPEFSTYMLVLTIAVGGWVLLETAKRNGLQI